MAETAVAAAVAVEATSTPLAVLQHRAKETRVETAEQVLLISVVLAVVVLAEQERMANHLPQQAAQDFPTIRFSTLAVVAAAGLTRLHL